MSHSTCASARGELLLAFELAGQFADLALRAGIALAGALVEALEPVALALGRRQIRPHGGEHVFEIDLAGLFERKQFGQLGDLHVEPLQGDVLAGHFLREEELHDRKDGQQEDDAEHQGRERVDETRPVIDAAVAAGARHGHAV